MKKNQLSNQEKKKLACYAECENGGMKINVFLLLFILLSTLKARATVEIPSDYFSDMTAGSFFLYNVTQQQFLTGSPAMSDTPASMTVAAVGGSTYSIAPASGGYLKMGLYGGQYLWNNAWADTGFFKWTFSAAGTKTYTLNITATSDADGYFINGTTYYLNTVNSVTTIEEDADEWALIAEIDYYRFLASATTIPSAYYTATPSAGTFYLYNLAQGGFLYRGGDGNYAGLQSAPASLELSSDGNGAFYIQFSDGKYLKTGSYNGYNVWTDATTAEWPWTFESFHGLSKVFTIKCPLNGPDYYIYSSASGVRGVNARTAPADYVTQDAWALISEADYLRYLASISAIGPAFYEATPSAGTFYLYNILHGGFLYRGGDGNYAGLVAEPGTATKIDLTLSSNGAGSYYIKFNDDKYLKTGSYNGYNVWTDATTTEYPWTFVSYLGVSGIYQLKCPLSLIDYYLYSTGNGATGVNARNSSGNINKDDAWALVSPARYKEYRSIIPSSYCSAPSDGGEYYIYDVVNNKFLNPATRALTDTPVKTATFTSTGTENVFKISGEDDRYLKIGVYGGQYLWSNGTDASGDYTNWTIEKVDNEYYIMTNDFGETDAAVAGKTWYITGGNVSDTRPVFSQWVLITVDNYETFSSNAAAKKSIIISAHGDATSLVINPNLDDDSGAGWLGGRPVDCNTWRGGNRDYENTSSADAEFTQTISNMPAGTYKLVGAVRGAIGTTATAKINDTAGTTITNGEFSTARPQLNTNGVQMPYSEKGGFRSGNALGWQWATVTYTLPADGVLTLSFAMEGTGFRGLDDVHLYYLSDGVTTYAMEYSDGIDNRGHVVTCDLTTDNPNKIFSSHENIYTASGDIVNNNLVSNGFVANLVLYDGYEFNAPRDFQASAGRLYRNITAGNFATICCPFAVTGGADGTFYQPTGVRVAANTIDLETVVTREGGKPYLYKAESAVTMLTCDKDAWVRRTVSDNGSGIVMKGTYNHIAAVPYDCYVVSGMKLYRVTSTVTLAPFRAYFELGESAVKGNVFTFSFDDQETALPTIDATSVKEREVYDLSGRRVANPHRGLYIVNGKKRVITNFTK